jgi:hypothetical protein
VKHRKRVIPSGREARRHPRPIDARPLLLPPIAYDEHGQPLPTLTLLRKAQELRETMKQPGITSCDYADAYTAVEMILHHVELQHRAIQFALGLNTPNVRTGKHGNSTARRKKRRR